MTSSVSAVASATRASLLSISIVLASVVALGPTTPVAATEIAASAHATPTQVVASFHTALLRAMHDGTYQGRYDALAPAMNRAFDFESMTRIAVGPRWFNLLPAQQRALVDAFRRFSIATYASQFDQYAGERFETAGPDEAAPQGTIVQTVMQPANDKPIRFNYLLHRGADGWRIVDIYLEGTISQLAVRRSEFTSVLAQSGPDGLANLLDQKTKRLAMAM
ncbi:MAG: ABC transporter substrate-binding protein [Alphaproteobacteria bacterium]|nr:ABC transporter substrate-binding protein [Alphaproteobacteria bacterium]